MEGNCLSESPPPSADICCPNELNRSGSDDSTLTSENCDDILHLAANVKPDDSRMWTNEKHGLYLEQLEASFVKQLHQSIGLHAECSDQSKRDKNITEMSQINGDNDSEHVERTTAPHGCWGNIDNSRDDTLSHDSPDSLTPIKSHRKLVTSHRLDACSQQFSTSSRDHGDSYDLMREGTGQNFINGDNQTKSNVESRAKRLKTALPD